jgi:formamidopyrimidine-DNA glycosylase
MPELPEVEYVARQLRTELIGHVIVRAEVLWARTVAALAPEDFVARVAGQRVTGVERRGKYLVIRLSADDVLLVHRRMSGNLIFLPAGVDAPYTRARFVLDDGRQLAFTDPRKFGRLAVLAASELPAALAALGPEPLDDAFTAAALGARLAGRARPIKALLLDQSVVAGLGR